MTTANVATHDIVPYMLLFLGLASLLVAAYYFLYVLALVGLGLVFWGALFLYIKPTKYVKLELLDAMSSSSLHNIERILTVDEKALKGIYLPPGNLQDYTSSLIFISTKPEQHLPTSAQTDPRQLYSENPVGLLLTPPGLAISKLLEKKLKRSFAETDLEELIIQLPRLFDQLEITKNLNFDTKENSIIVQIGNHIFENLSEETRKLPRTYQALGSPLASALACIFAKATGKSVTVEKEEKSPEGITTIRYSVLEK